MIIFPIDGSDGSGRQANIFKYEKIRWLHPVAELVTTTHDLVRPCEHDVGDRASNEVVHNVIE